ncbi:unnamed protein product [Mycena citricolor]|uniref:Acyltransferase 3 domain-containing protein n=1 Tax=Mycena citricolor TaxID=2018698 RepID=A0AAD2HUN8_9AGAR|nr:unnamed protein product [Mycena citricolor]
MGHSVVITVFQVVNQSFFMGLLFFLSGHFSSHAADHKTWKQFVLDKLKRLGIPAVVYRLSVQPLTIFLVRWSQHLPVLSALVEYYRHLNGVRGVVWYLAVLLVFDLVYVTVRKYLPSLSYLVPRSLGAFRAAAFVSISAVIVASFLVRLSHPVGHSYPPLNVQLAYAPQYVLAYTAGTCLSKIQQFILRPHPGRDLALTLLVAILSAVALYTISPSISLMLGGMNPFALLYAIWSELCFYFLGTSLFAGFHRWKLTSKKWGSTARYAYGAYLVHALVVVGLQILLHSSPAPPLLKALIVGLSGVCLSWAGGRALLGIPGASRIL